MCLESHASAARPAALKVLILTVLLAWAFWPELAYAAQLMLSSSDWTHGLVAPLALLLLVARRRRYLAQDLTRGSVWGVILLLLSFAVYAANIWPWAYGYFRHVAFVPAAGGVVLATCGWRVLKRCLPLLLILLLSIPVGPRYYAGLIIKPETYTLAAARVVLDRLPGVDVQLHGPDLDFATADATGTVATGEPRRGASMLLTYAVLGVFVVFARVRPSWQALLMALAAVPIVLLCNLLRLLCWGVISIYAQPDPVSPVPRAIAAAVSLVLAYLFFAAACGVLGWLGTAFAAGERDGQGQDEEVADA